MDGFIASLCRVNLLRRVGLATAALGLWAGTAPTAHAQTPPPCLANFTSPLSIPVTGNLTEVIIDDQCAYAYATNATSNEIEVVSLRTGSPQAPIKVGSAPTGLDISPDGKTLYVANSGGNDLSVVDLRTGVVTKTVPVVAGFSNDTPFSLAVAQSGLVLFSTTFAGSGFGGRLMQFDPSSNTVSQRKDFFSGGATTEVTYLRASGNRSAIGIVAGDISSAPVFLYSSAANSFTPEKDLNGFVSYVALDQSGATVMVNPGTYVLNGSLLLQGTIPGGTYGVAADPAGAVGYQVGPSGIDVLDLKRFTKTGNLPLGDTLNAANSFRHGVGELAISRDGAVLAVLTDHGLSLVQTNIIHSIPFASMSAHAQLQLRHGPALDAFELTGHFTPGKSSKGIDPSTARVALQVGSAVEIIPAGSFKRHADDFDFAGTVGGVKLRITIDSYQVRGYRFVVSADNVNLSGSTLPLTVGWVIGADRGSAVLDGGDVLLETAR